MRLLLDFGDGAGWVDYSAALAAPSARPGRSDTSTTVEGLRLERARGAYARCTGWLDVPSAGLAVPVAGCRVQAVSSGGAVLFRGLLVKPPEQVAAASRRSHPVRFEALEEAWLANMTPDGSLQPSGGAVHPLDLQEHAVHLDREPVAGAAGDITVAGLREAATYVTELFQGDGTTTAFALVDVPFREQGGATLLEDAFASPQFRGDVWRLADGGSYLGQGSGGLRMGGGNGLDGQTVLAAQTTVEMGGTLLAEMRGVVLQPGSDGVLLGMYGNTVSRATCFAGIRVKGAGGAGSLAALVNGEETGTPCPLIAGHSYTLRLRLHCAEVQRTHAAYQAVVNGAVQLWGGGLVDAPMQTVLEVLDEGLASSTPATVLYAGAVTASLAAAVFAPVNSVSLVGSAGRVLLQRQGSLWVTSTRPDGAVVTRRPGTLDTGEDFAMHGGTVSFFPGRVPAASELVTVQYRLGRRAVARLQSAEALLAMRSQGLPGLRTEVCRVLDPEPRSAVDCAAAAAALLAFEASPSHGVRGTCSLVNAFATRDVLPGDRVALPLLPGAPVEVPVVRVTIEDAHAVTEILRYRVAFAQTAENGLSFSVSGDVPADAVVPAATYAASTTASLPELAVTAVSAGSLQMDAGVSAPVGGGFEVRRHDGGWGPDVAGALPDAELVLRSPVRSFSVPRASFAERFYVRMYDGAEVPVYSAESSLVVTHLPVS